MALKFSYESCNGTDTFSAFYQAALAPLPPPPPPPTPLAPPPFSPPKDWAPEIASASAGGTLLLALALCFVLYIIRWARRAEARKEGADREIVLNAIQSTRNLSHPAVLMKAEDFLGLEQLQAHEAMRDAAKLSFYDLLNDLEAIDEQETYYIFISHRERRATANACDHASLPTLLTNSVRLSMHAYHCHGMAEWTSWTEPDPSGLQFEVMKAAVQAVASIYGWPLENVMVWCDYVRRTPDHRGTLPFIHVYIATSMMRYVTDHVPLVPWRSSLFHRLASRSKKWPFTH